MPGFAAERNHNLLLSTPHTNLKGAGELVAFKSDPEEVVELAIDTVNSSVDAKESMEETVATDSRRSSPGWLKIRGFWAVTTTLEKAMREKTCESVYFLEPSGYGRRERRGKKRRAARQRNSHGYMSPQRLFLHIPRHGFDERIDLHLGPAQALAERHMAEGPQHGELAAQPPGPDLRVPLVLGAPRVDGHVEPALVEVAEAQVLEDRLEGVCVEGGLAQPGQS